jgi:hypothetical protein
MIRRNALDAQSWVEEMSDKESKKNEESRRNEEHKRDDDTTLHLFATKNTKTTKKQKFVAQ